MSVYVDPLFSVHPDRVQNKQAKRLTAKYGQWCHCMADDDEELLRFGARLGMKLAWVQHLGSAKAHFDLVPTRRIAAVRMGAVEITREQMMALITLKSAALTQGIRKVDFLPFVTTKTEEQPKLL